MYDHATVEPRVLVCMTDRWPCVLTGAELRERNVAASCVERVALGLFFAEPGEFGPVRVVLCDRESLSSLDVALLQWLRALGDGPLVAVVAAASAEVSPGPWDCLLRRPTTIGALADEVERLVRTPAAAHLDPPVGPVTVRVGPPWPVAFCSRCGGARHCEPPRTAIEREEARLALAQFAVEHAHGDEPAAVVRGSPA